jgi:hypothetical protein
LPRRLKQAAVGPGHQRRRRQWRTVTLFPWLINHQPIILFSHNKPATSNQPAVLFSQDKPAPVISHQPNEQAVGGRRRKRRLSYGPPWAHYLGGYQYRLLGGPLGLPGLRYTAPEGVEHKDYIGVVLG